MAPVKRMAAHLKKLRMMKKMSQAELAEKAGISRGYLIRLEAAQQDPTLGTLEKLARALGVPVTELLG